MSRNVLTAGENRGVMKQALAIHQKSAVQKIGLHSGNTSGATNSPYSKWQEREWDTDTLIALCHLPIRRLVAEATKSGAFNLENIIDFLGGRALSDVTTVDLVTALLRTISIPILCSEMCSLHDRIKSPQFLDQAASVGLLQYASAMLASRYALFMGGIPEMHLGLGETNCEPTPCSYCIDAIICCLRDKKVIHVGMVHALSGQKEMDSARGGWSRYQLLLAHSSVNTHVQRVMEAHVANCYHQEIPLCCGERFTMAIRHEPALYMPHFSPCIG